ncbi:hypothetical protein HPB48_024412 [Haemaphysalis longicornis]|uniref:MADF domain-containing protein n=1 Tax=Haemaphysalis longicornis TaxID=44386 RepID=A0A9J6H7Q1_HAELO|nr:hypothetical protein HPB48_024412 [Haemaphysalis longicornis]
MSDDFTVRLCKLVQGHPELYDIFNDNFHNEDAKNSAWNLISTELGVPQSKCVIKWKSLKHQFVKAKKDQNTTWDLWPALQFLDEAADKGGPRKRKSMAATTGPDNADPLDSGSRKRKRESMAAATRLDDGTDLMDSMCIDDLVGGDDSTGTTAELTGVEILAEVTTERTNEDAAEVVPPSADSAPLPTSTEASAVVALPHHYCSAIKGIGMSLVERLDCVEEVVYNTPGYSAAVL